VKLEFPNGAQIPLRLQEIVSKALKKNASERYQAAEEMLKHLKEFSQTEIQTNNDTTVI